MKLITFFTVLVLALYLHYTGRFFERRLNGFDGFDGFARPNGLRKKKRRENAGNGGDLKKQKRTPASSGNPLFVWTKKMSLM